MGVPARTVRLRDEREKIEFTKKLMIFWSFLVGVRRAVLFARLSAEEGRRVNWVRKTFRFDWNQ